VSSSTETLAPTSRFLPTTMATALFMDLLDTAALGSALPTMAGEFHTEALRLKLALTSYLMTMAILVTASGWLADRYGARRVFVNAILVYLTGSLCCGLSNSVGGLVASRILQGIGGAMMTPVARLIVVASTPRGARAGDECLHHSGDCRTADGPSAGGLSAGIRQLAVDLLHQTFRWASSVLPPSCASCRNSDTGIPDRSMGLDLSRRRWAS